MLWRWTYNWPVSFYDRTQQALYPVSHGIYLVCEYNCLCQVPQDACGGQKTLPGFVLSFHQVDPQNRTHMLSLGADSLFLLSYLIDPQSLLELSHVHLLTLFFFDTCGVLVVIDNLMIFRITQVSKPQCFLWGAFRSGLADLNVAALE